VVSPLLPLADPSGFARALEAACDAVILDHYLIGDGSENGLRTQRTGFRAALDAGGFAERTRREKLDEIEGIFRHVFEDEARVLISRMGFNDTRSGVAANRVLPGASAAVLPAGPFRFSTP
jgi:hypothetical protein